MKKLFILAAAIVAFASCQKEEPETVINDGTVKFISGPVTRATDETTVDDFITEFFIVSGYAGATELFTNEIAYYKTDFYQTNTIKYWADNIEYNFFAVHPTSLTMTVADDQKTASFSFTNDGETDLVVAGGYKAASAAKKEDGAQALSFKHALSRVKFTFKNNFEAGKGVWVKVTDVKLLDQPATASCTITSNGNTFAWGGTTGTMTVNYVVNNEFDGSKIDEQASNSTEYKYILPGTGKDCLLACIIDVYDDENVLIRRYDYSAGIKINTGTADAEDVTHDYVAGKSYLYTMNISSGLNPITFTVSVENWEKGNGENGENIVFPN